VINQLDVFISTILVMITILALKIGVILNKDANIVTSLMMMQMNVLLIAALLRKELPILL